MTAQTRTPLLPQIGVLSFGPDYWSPIWEPRHHVMSRLAAYFTVLWLEPPHGWRDSRRAWQEARKREPITPPGLHLSRQALWLPRFYRTRWLDNLTRRARLRKELAWLKAAGASRIVLYIWRPDFLFALDDVAADLVLYHIDDEYSFSDDEPVIPDEMVLLERADHVIVHSPALMEKKGGVNPHTTLIPNGVDFAGFATPRAEPADIANIPHPRIGYAGYLKRQLDWRLLGDLARRHPEWSFVFVGGTRQHTPMEGIKELSSCANAYFLGAKAAREMSDYPQHFDCCIMPYNDSTYTSYIYPMKLHEYLASGRPVVGTPIRTVREYSHVVELARTVDEWSAAIGRALSAPANTPERRRQRQEIARRHAWDTLAFKIAGIIANGLGEAFPTERELCPRSGEGTT